LQSSFYTNFTTGLSAQEAQLNALQQQITTGLAVQTPDQNPSAFQTATLANDQVAALTNDNTTQAKIQTQLGSVNDIYQSVSSLFDNVQSVLEQALNGTTSTQNLQSLAAQVQSAQSQLVGLGNTTGTDGTYLFGGTRGTIPPFQTNTAGNIVYVGDAGQSQAAITPNIAVTSIANGGVFATGLAGDGFATVAASAGNTGNADLLAQGITNAAAANAFQSGTAPITISFASGGTGITYTATQSGATLATGSATASATGSTDINVAGLSFQLNGTPAAGDGFTISPSRPQSAFSLLQNIYTELSTASATPSASAQTRTALNNSLASLAQYQQSVITAQAQNGVTLQALTAAASSNASQSTSLQAAVQGAVGANTATAITQLDETSTAIQAAMKAFASVQNLDLFQYL
jgi:flagellar hook-associated protein 3 FlgL